MFVSTFLNQNSTFYVLYTIPLFIEFISSSDIKGVLWEAWTNITLGEVSQQFLSRELEDQKPCDTQFLQEFQAPRDYGQNFGSRMRAYFVPPETGIYTFYLSCNKHCDFYASADHESSHEVLVGSIEKSKGVE